MTGTIFDIKEFAVFDGPGIRTTVFLKGCPLQCQWCHNPQGLSPYPQLMVSKAACTNCGQCRSICPTPDHCNACGRCIPVCRGGYRRIVGENWTAEKLAERLLKDKDVYAMSGGGVTFSGGEPLMQWTFVSEVLRMLPEVHTAVETSGFTSDKIFREAMDACSLVMMDWKVSDPQRHRFFTGVEQGPIRRHLQMLCSGSTPFIVRMPIIPSVNDNEEHFQTVADLIKDAPSLLRVDILPYQRAAGAKYEMVGKKYLPDFDEEQPIRLFTDVFEKVGIPYRLFT